MTVLHPAADAGPVPSPCVNLCKMDAQGALCQGCLRTIDEIAGWSAADDDAKRAVWRAIDARRLCLARQAARR